MTDIKWVGTSAEISNNEYLIDYLRQNKIGENDKNIYRVTNQKNLFFLEEEFIESKTFGGIIDKLSKKDFQDKIKHYDKGTLRIVDFDGTDEIIFERVIENNNITGIDERKCKLSLNALKCLNQSEKVNYFINICILIFLSNTTIFNNGHFIFKINSYESERVSELDFSSIEELELYPFYNWIVNDKEYPAPYMIKLQIFREVILSKNAYEVMVSDLDTCKSIFNRVINRETKGYFEQLNKLKDDFFKVSESRNKIYSSLHLKLLGWLSALGIFIYNQVQSSNKTMKLTWNILNDNLGRTKIILLMLLFALGIIFIVFGREVYLNKQEYKRTKKFYLEKLFVEENDFDEYMFEPRIGKLYIIIFIVLLVVLGYWVYKIW